MPAVALSVGSRRPRLPWPLPAVLAWAVGWALLGLMQAGGWPVQAAVAAGAAAGGALGLAQCSRWRRLIVAAGFPVSWLASGPALPLPAWGWLLPLALLLLAYPRRAWRDAPFFPTPAAALDGLGALAPLARHARVLDAGCGLGHGLSALRRAYPEAAIEGVEWSPLLCAVAWLRCRWARVRRADLWAGSWRDFDLVYLFQRPESMPRAVAKAQQEMAPGAWLVSLEFEAEALAPAAVCDLANGRRLWIYRLASVARASSPPQERRQTR